MVLLTALMGLAQSVAVLAIFALAGVVIGRVGRQITQKNKEQWREYRLQRFWLINMLSAPVIIVIFFISARVTGLSLTETGLNLNHLSISLLIAVPTSLILGTISAISSYIAVKEGIKPIEIALDGGIFDAVGIILYAAIFVGPLEEFIFRGVIQALLMKDIGESLNIGPIHILYGTVIAAIIFVAYHYRNVMVGGETRKQFLTMIPGRLTLSLFLSFLFQGTGSLLGPIVFHNIIDTCTLATLVVTTYQKNHAGLQNTAVKTEE